MYDVNFIEPKSDSEKRQELIESINRYSDKRLSKGQKEVLQRAIENLPNILDAQQLFDWLTIARADSFNFDYTPVYSNSKIAVLKNSEILNGCINPKINEATGQRDYLNENKLIIGDNFDALNNLLLTHKGKIDVIYIDPPYNTDSMKNDGNHADERLLETLDQKTEDGKSKFIYNDSFYRDDWLSMMKLRLEKAKKLMSAGGVIFVSIDDSEQAYLKVLMDEIFGEENFICNLNWITKSGGGDDSKAIRNVTEYILMYGNSANIQLSRKDVVDWSKYKLEDEYIKERGRYLEKSLADAGLTYQKSLDYPIEYNGKTYYAGYDFDNWKERQNGKHRIKDYQWRWSKQKYEWGLENGFIIHKNNKIYYKQYEFVDNNGKPIKRTNIHTNLIDNCLGGKGTSLIKELNLIFSHPKPVELIKYLLKLIPNKNTTVLDFFAGSATTGQAVMELNREDGGNRKFILCTNNQNKIGETVCAERLYRVITGKSSDKITEFDWIKNNEPYSNESVGIYETKIMDLDFDPEVSNVKSVQDLGNDVIRVYSQFSNEIINENVFNSLTTLPIIERKED